MNSNTSQFNDYELREIESDVPYFVELYRNRINKELKKEQEAPQSEFYSFAEKKVSLLDIKWIEDNREKFLEATPNKDLVTQYYLKECGYILCMVYSADGEKIILGFSSGNNMTEKSVLKEYADLLEEYYNNEQQPKLWYPMFYNGAAKRPINYDWVNDNYERFLKNTPNQIQYHRWFFSETGAITSMQFSPNGNYIIVGHSSGLIEMRNGITGAVLCTLRNIQFPPRPVYALQFSPFEENICYAACQDGSVYRIEIPHLDAPLALPPMSAIRADPTLETINTQFYGCPGTSSYYTPYITNRNPAMSMGVLCESKKIVVGYEDSSIKIFDMETQELELTYKVYKSRLQYIPKKLQRMHFEQVVALRTHPEKNNMFATGAWDKTLRIWDARCKVGCIMTFEGVDICGDSIDLNREHCLTGSWTTTDGLCVWDLTAHKRLNIIRVQNRRQDVDGEYIYACRYWHSTDYNRKGKYGIIGGSGTKCVEVINLHNRYITCSYPAAGTVLAIASHQERIAFGGTYPAFCIVSFHDPKHEKELYKPPVIPDYDYTKPSLTLLTDYTTTDSVPSSAGKKT